VDWAAVTFSCSDSRMNAPNSTSCADAELATTDTVGKPDINVGLEQAQERKSRPGKKTN
jgi:hypothetical protein